MNLYPFSLLLVAFINFTLGIYIYFRNRKSNLYKIFLGLTTSLGLWCLGTFFTVLYSGDLNLFGFFERTTFVSGLLISLFFYIFCINFPYKSASSGKYLISLYGAIILIYTYVIFFTTWFAQNTISINSYTTLQHNDTWFICWVIAFLLPLVAGLLQLFYKFKATDGIYREYLLTLLLVAALPILFSLYFDVYLVGLENYQYNSISPFSSLLFDFAILRMILIKRQ